MFLWHASVERLKVTVTNHKDLNDVPHNLGIESYGKLKTFCEARELAVQFEIKGQLREGY